MQFRFCGRGPRFPLPLLILFVESTQFPFALAITSSMIDTSDERCKWAEINRNHENVHLWWGSYWIWFRAKWEGGAGPLCARACSINHKTVMTHDKKQPRSRFVFCFDTNEIIESPFSLSSIASRIVKQIEGNAPASRISSTENNSLSPATRLPS